MGKYGYKYRVEITAWVRSRDGDDWIDHQYWLNFNTLDEAMTAANPTENTKQLIETVVYNMEDSRDLVYKRDWINGKIDDYTLVPDFEYYNRDYDR